MKKIFILSLFLMHISLVKAQKFDKQAILQLVKILSSDSLKGRKTGTRGNEMARTLIKDFFLKNNLKSFRKDSLYLSPFQIGNKKGYNVLGYIKGSENPEQYIVVSAHYDHLGTQGGKVYNGADDNASGIGGLIAAAEYFSFHPPKRSIIFAAFDAEEIELLGSKAFIELPPVSLDKIFLNVNMDMISRSDKEELFVCGTHYFPNLKKLISNSKPDSMKVKVRFGHDTTSQDPSYDWTFASDHGPFFEKNIPFIYFGVEDHEDYHKPTDDFEKIDKNFYISSIQLIIRTIESVDHSIGYITPQNKLK